MEIITILGWVIYFIITALVGYTMFILTSFEKVPHRLEIIAAAMITWPIAFIGVVLYLIWMLFDYREKK